MNAFEQSSIELDIDVSIGTERTDNLKRRGMGSSISGGKGYVGPRDATVTIGYNRWRDGVHHVKLRSKSGGRFVRVLQKTS